MRDIFNDLELTLGFVPAILTNVNTAQVSAIIDRQGFDAVLFAVQLGALTDANATFTALLEHGDAANLSDAAAVTAAEDLLGTIAGASGDFNDDNKCIKLGYRGSKRYCRLTITPAGNDAGSIPISCTVIKALAELGPRSTQKTS